MGRGAGEDRRPEAERGLTMATKKKSDYPTREQAIEFLELAIDNIRDGDIDVPSWEFLRKLIRSEHEQRRGRKRGEQKKVVLGLLAGADPAGHRRAA